MILLYLAYYKTELIAIMVLNSPSINLGLLRDKWLPVAIPHAPFTYISHTQLKCMHTNTHTHTIHIPDTHTNISHTHTYHYTHQQTPDTYTFHMQTPPTCMSQISRIYNPYTFTHTPPAYTGYV